MNGFTHLHCHSVWSLLDGAIPAEALAHLAAERGFEAVALTDHDALTGAVRFSKACRAAGVKPIYGAELTVATSAAPGGARLDGGGPGHVTLIARDKIGYANLCRLISEAHLSNERGSPLSSMEKIAQKADGLFVLSGCARGEIALAAAAGRMPEAAASARKWREAIGDGYRIEVFDHRGYGDHTLRDRLLRIAKEANIPAVATNDVHYAAPLAALRAEDGMRSDACVHELLHAINAIVPLSHTQALRQTSEYFLKGAPEMRDLFYDAPEAADESLRIADACDYDLDFDTYHFPELPIPKGYTPTGLLAKRCHEGARRRFDRVTKGIEDRLQHELGVIFKMGWAAYFLLVADIVDHVRDIMGIRCACRGSAAGSLVCYVLGISDVDPVRYDLLFERFMNSRRDELPDIDVDVESHRREEVLDYIGNAYGKNQTAVCCMVDTFRARMAIREVGKALGMPADEIDVVAKAFPHVRAKDIPAALERLPELSGANLKAGQLDQLFELCLAIDGWPRHLALHPSGVILSSPDLADRVPMESSFQGFTMLQADKDDAEALGLVKLDVLGVRMLSSIAHACGEIARVRSEHHGGVDVNSIPRDDAATFELIRSSRTLGCFQIESPGQRELLARFQPNRFEDLVIDISLFRPGPVKSDMVSPFLERRHGFEPVRYPHPSLAAILEETHGVVVYHEQVIRVIAAVTGCSLDDADYVRRHLGDADADDVGVGGVEVTEPEGGLAGWFVGAAASNGFSRKDAETLWREVVSFASFGFCKSHAAAFALPTYISAWLKAHYPAEFLAGVLTHDPGMYPRRLIVADARLFGIPILPIDVNASDEVYRVEQTGGKPGIRLALSEVRGISEAETGSILAARGEHPFISLEDLWRRTDLSRPVLENLIHVGALDSMSVPHLPSRSKRELLWRAVELYSEPRPRPGAQMSLALDEGGPSEVLGSLPEYTSLEETEAELDISGIDASRHIMDLYSLLTAELGCVSAGGLRAVRNNSQVWVAGVKVASQTPAIRSGQRIIFVTLDEVAGPIDVTVFERVQRRAARTVFHSWLLLVKGVARKRGGASLVHPTDPGNVGITVVAQEVFDLAELAADRKAGHSLAAAIGRQRRKQVLAGLPTQDGDLRPAGRLWHSSGGSAGR